MSRTARRLCDWAHIAFCAMAPGFSWAERERRRVAEGTMQYLLILMLAITMACGAAAGVTISLAPAYADDSGKGY